MRYALLLGLLLALPLPLAGQAGVERFGVVMGTELRVEVAWADRSEALAAAEAALREIEQMDALLTTWNPGNPMSALNRAPVGTPTRTDAKLIALLAEAERWAAHTGRAFDPTIGPLIDAWGLRRGGARPDSAGLAAARAAVGAHAFRVDAERSPGSIPRRGSTRARSARAPRSARRATACARAGCALPCSTWGGSCSRSAGTA